ncbi:GNAT family N-acetyltransferase [Rhizobium deserti]|uniref:GNAT family N-acetyltransferase n=1 Tax=Rhizobium deserti TaxID=2547961 RepID=A0A4R5U9G7_9HYPH|nr:GNAT family N-acetyltransferase [Rhizobium deserti]
MRPHASSGRQQFRHHIIARLHLVKVFKRCDYDTCCHSRRHRTSRPRHTAVHRGTLRFRSPAGRNCRESLAFEQNTGEPSSLVGVAKPNSSVPEDSGAICSVGGATRSGEITLNYILPKVRFRGFSKAMVLALEQALLSWDHTRVRLTSTRTAKPFYHSMGYEDAGAPAFWGQLPGYPMVKAIG